MIESVGVAVQTQIIKLRDKLDANGPHFVDPQAADVGLTFLTTGLLVAGVCVALNMSKKPRKRVYKRAKTAAKNRYTAYKSRPRRFNTKTRR